jgi:hypothetical protein
VRLLAKIAVILARDSALEKKIFSNDDEPNTIDDASPGPTAGASKNVTVAADGVYHQIRLDGVSPSFLYIETDVACTVRLNSLDGTSGTEIPLTPVPDLVTEQTPGQAVPLAPGTLLLRGQLGAFDLWIRNTTSGVNAQTAKVLVVYGG